MAILKERWFLDVVGQRLVRDLNSNLDVDLPPLTQGDTIDAEIHTVEPNGSGGFRYVDLDALTCRAGLFSLTDTAPSEGKVKWGYDGDWTDPLDIDASEASILEALNALSSVTSAGGITSVEKESTGTYTFTWTTEGERELILADVDDCYPSAYSKSRRKIAGDEDTAEVQRVTLRTNAAAGQTDWDPLDSPVASVETLSTGNDQVQRITFNITPVDGQLLLGYGAVTAVVPVSGDARDLQAALESLEAVGDGNVTVTGDFATGFIVVFGGIAAGDVEALVPDSSGLVGPKGKKAQIEIEGPEVDDLLGDAEETKALFEIEMRDEGRPHTLLQLEVELRNGRWEPESDTRPPSDRILGESVAESRYVRYDESQTLSSGNKSQARANIGVDAAWLAGLDLSTLPTSNPGDGKLWLNGGVLMVGPA
jgi:hypothetical protein